MAAAFVVGWGIGADGGSQPSEAIVAQEDMPERYLWAAVLDRLISVRDGKAYWLDSSKRKSIAIELEQAFDDLMKCGPMTRHCCRWLDTDPQILSKSFIRWCESHMV